MTRNHRVDARCASQGDIATFSPLFCDFIFVHVLGHKTKFYVN